jgi:dTDP-4-dehydrorhamnose reductase
MRILITGGHGQLGRDLRAALAPPDVFARGRDELDVADGAAVDAAFAQHRPEAIVHCAALTDTARCEREPGTAEAVNAAGPEHVAKAASRHDAMLFAISTNEVFDGGKSAPYIETDAPEAVNAYGASKLEGERRAMRANPAVRIARTSWLYGDGGNNFVEKVLAAARSGRALSFVSDEVATPTSTRDLAEALRSMIEREAPPGVYHLVNEGEASRYDWAREILRLAGMTGMPVAAVTTAELRAGGYDGPRKPMYSVLANTTARALGVTLRPWQDALAAYFERAAVRAHG